MSHHDEGVEIHMARSLKSTGHGVYAQCGRVVLNENKWTTLWKDVTCGNCHRCRKDKPIQKEGQHDIST